MSGYSQPSSCSRIVDGWLTNPISMELSPTLRTMNLPSIVSPACAMITVSSDTSAAIGSSSWPKRPMK